MQGINQFEKYGMPISSIKAIGIMIIWSFTALTSALMAQGARNRNPDPPAYEFKDGIYANIDMVRNNRPIPPAWIEADMQVNDRHFYKTITKKNRIIFYDDNGVRTALETKSIWGYGSKGDLFINVGGAFHKIDFFGRISHFIASKATFVPLAIFEDNRPLEIEFPSYVQVTARHREYLVDIIENKVWEFDVEGLERVLKEDTQLHDEYMALKKRNQEKSKFNFLRRYNEKYPFDIPFLQEGMQ